MKNIKINQSQAQDIFERLSQKYGIVAPVEEKGRGRFSDTNLLTYGQVKNFDEINFSMQTYFSPKATLFPTRETMFVFKDKVVQKSKDDIPPTIIFLRACDIHAISVLDTHFLTDGIYKDHYYEKRREQIKIFLIECPVSFENCYCVSMNTNKTDKYSAFMRKTDSGYELGIKDKDIEDFFPSSHDNVKGPQFVKNNPRSVTIPEITDMSIFYSDIWEDYSQRCISCGRCNVSCPTCTCFTVKDISTDENNLTKRKRIWSACHVKEFGLLTGGHDFRLKAGDRMRYKTLHKISDFKKRNGIHMCIGCGRCDDVCPVYISMFKCIDKINTIIEEK